MDNENQVLEPQVETEVAAEPVTETIDTAAILEQLEQEREARRKITARAAQAEAEKKALEAKLNKVSPAPAKADVTDIINISNALEGLDKIEKEYLAEQHRLSGKSLQEIREGRDFQYWQKSYRAEAQPEIALRPNATQASEPEVESWMQKLMDPATSLAEKEEILASRNLYRNPRPKSTQNNIGQPRTS